MVTALKKTSSYPLPQNSSPVHFINGIKSHAFWDKCVGEFVFRLVILWMQSHTFLQIVQVRNIHFFFWPFQKTSFCFHDGNGHSILKLLLWHITDIQKKEISCLSFWKDISPYILFSWFLPEVVVFLEILKQFIMWFVIFFYKLHVFSDMNVKDIEISFYYWAVSCHHRRRKRHFWPKVNIRNCLNVNLTGRKKLAGRFLKKRSS